MFFIVNSSFINMLFSSIAIFESPSNRSSNHVILFIASGGVWACGMWGVKKR